MTNNPSSQAVVLITGGARRIGAAIARRFHGAGCRLVIHYNHSREEAEQLARELDGASVQADLTRRDDVERLARDSLACFGRIDYLINNASSYYPTPLPETSQAQWDDLIDSNLRAAFFLTRDLHQELKRHGGSVVNIIDAMCEGGMEKHSIYSIAKSGLAAMTRSLARELGPAIRVNGVSPGAILWPASLEDSALAASANPQEIEATRNAVLAQIPLGALGTPEAIADATYFLAVEASYMTGSILKVDGGRSLG
jgi:pteridine reductase